MKKYPSKSFVNFILILGVIFGAGCAKTSSTALQNASSFKMSRWYPSITPDAVPTIQVFNSANEPVKNAKVLIGNGQGANTIDHLLVTDENGQVAAPTWTETSHITVEAKDFIRQTLLNQNPGVLQVKLNDAYKNPRAVIKGQVTNLPVVNSDKNIDFALVIPTISKVDLLNFDIGAVISPYTDIISIIGIDSALPSNVSLPTQKESYFLPITLSKPEHRVYATTYGPKTYFAMAGKFPFKTVIGELQAGKKFYDIINNFSFVTGGLREITIASPTSELNIPGNEINFANQVQVKGSAVQADEVIMALAMNDLSGRFVPSDVKRLTPAQDMKLNVMAGQPTYVVSFLRKQADFDPATADQADRSSASMLKYTQDMTTSVLPLMAAPIISEDGGAYKIVIPAGSTLGVDSETINPLAVSASISDIKTVQDGDLKVEIMNRRWEILGSSWPAEINLPAWPLQITDEADANTPDTAASKRKFDVNLIGSQTTSQADLGDDLIKAATHVTHSAARY